LGAEGKIDLIQLIILNLGMAKEKIDQSPQISQASTTALQLCTISYNQNTSSFLPVCL
jgi:hypothetical protein